MFHASGSGVDGGWSGPVQSHPEQHEETGDMTEQWLDRGRGLHSSAVHGSMWVICVLARGIDPGNAMPCAVCRVLVVFFAGNLAALLAMQEILSRECVNSVKNNPTKVCFPCAVPCCAVMLMMMMTRCHVMSCHVMSCHVM